MLHLKEHLPHLRPGPGLDVGTRLGEFALTLLEAMPAGSGVIGMDCDGVVVEQAREKHAGKGLEFVVGDGEEIPFEDGFFELVALSNTLHHIERYDTVLDEMIRVLRPGGTFLVNEMFSDRQNEAQQTHLRQHTLEARLDMISGRFQRPTWRRDEIAAILSRLPLNDVHMMELREEPEMDQKLAAKTVGLVSAVEKKAIGHPAFQALLDEAGAIQTRLEETGIQRCTQLVYWGRKG